MTCRVYAARTVSEARKSRFYGALRQPTPEEQETSSRVRPHAQPLYFSSAGSTHPTASAGYAALRSLGPAIAGRPRLACPGVIRPCSNIRRRS